MKYVIRKVPERNTEYLERILPEPLIFSDVNHNGCRWSFEQALKLANDDAVYVQDDMILCKNFVNIAEEYIIKYPTRVIVFSNFTTEKNKMREGFYTARQGCWLMCTYIPKFVADAFIFAKEHELIKISKNTEKYDFDDAEFSSFLDSFNEKVFVAIPNLAGHPKNKSVTGFKRASRICINFDYNNVEV